MSEMISDGTPPAESVLLFEYGNLWKTKQNLGPTHEEVDHRLKPTTAERKLEVAQSSVTRIRDSIKELSGELMGKIITVGAFDEESYAIRLMTAPWRPSIRRNFQSACTKPVTGKLASPTIQESYSFDGEFILEPTNLLTWIRGAYYINPIGKNGEQQVSLTVAQ